jgi:hypothetical protein
MRMPLFLENDQPMSPKHYPHSYINARNLAVAIDTGLVLVMPRGAVAGESRNVI